MRTAWLLAGSAITVLALVMSTVSLSRGLTGARPPSDNTVRTIPFRESSQLRIEASEGDVRLTVHAGEAGEILLDRWLRWSQEKPSVSEDWDGRTLRLDTSCARQDRPDEPICEVDYQLYVPPETDLEAITSTGQVAVGRMHGDVRVDSVSGDVHVSGTPGSVWVRSGSGSVRGFNLDTGQTDVEVGSGDVDLSFRTPPTSVRAVVRTQGDVSLDLPEATYDATANAPDVSMSIDRDTASPRKVTVSTREGTVDICC